MRPYAVLLVPVVLLPMVPTAVGASAAGADRVPVVVRGLGVDAARGQVGGLSVRHRLPLVDGFSASLTRGQARALERLPGVRVDRVRRVSVTDTATDRDFGAQLARQTFGVTGTGVGICAGSTPVSTRRTSRSRRGR